MSDYQISDYHRTNDKTNFPYETLLTDRQIFRIGKTFANKLVC